MCNTMANVLPAILGCILGIALASDEAALNDETHLLQYTAVVRTPEQAVQTEMPFQRKGQNVTDPCACLNFAEVYRTGMAKCGDGMELNDPELYETDKNAVPLPPRLKDGDYCQDWNPPFSKKPPGSCFFPKQDHTMCVKTLKAKGPEPKPIPDTWCYVKASCQSLNGGRHVNSLTSLKICGDSDPKLGDLPPAQLFAMVKAYGTDEQTTALLAYPWRGPKELKGEMYFSDITGPGTYVGASKKFDTFKVIGGNQTVWEIHDEAICVAHCEQPSS